MPHGLAAWKLAIPPTIGAAEETGVPIGVGLGIAVGVGVGQTMTGSQGAWIHWTWTRRHPVGVAVGVESEYLRQRGASVVVRQAILVQIPTTPSLTWQVLQPSYQETQLGGGVEEGLVTGEPIGMRVATGSAQALKG